jgi:hypothetical protein
VVDLDLAGVELVVEEAGLEVAGLELAGLDVAGLDRVDKNWTVEIVLVIFKCFI